MLEFCLDVSSMFTNIKTQIQTGYDDRSKDFVQESAESAQDVTSRFLVWKEKQPTPGSEALLASTGDLEGESEQSEGEKFQNVFHGKEMLGSSKSGTEGGTESGTESDTESDTESNGDTTVAAADGLINTVSGEEVKEQCELVHATQKDADADENQVHEKINQEKSLTTKAIEWMKQRVGKECSASSKTSALEIKLCVALMFDIVHAGAPHPHLGMIANVNAVKCLRETIMKAGKDAYEFTKRKLFGKGATETQDTQDTQDTQETQEKSTMLLLETHAVLQTTSCEQDSDCQDGNGGTCDEKECFYDALERNEDHASPKSCEQDSDCQDGKGGTCDEKECFYDALEGNEDHAPLLTFCDERTKKECTLNKETPSGRTCEWIPSSDPNKGIRAFCGTNGLSSSSAGEAAAEAATATSVLSLPKHKPHVDNGKYCHDYCSPTANEVASSDTLLWQGCQAKKELPFFSSKFHEKYCKQACAIDLEVPNFCKSKRDLGHALERANAFTQMLVEQPVAADVTPPSTTTPTDADLPGKDESTETDEETFDMDLVAASQSKCDGQSSGHTCKDSMSIVMGLLPHFGHKVGFDYSMRECGPLFSKHALKGLSSFIDRATAGMEDAKEIKTIGGEETKEKERKAEAIIRNQQGQDQLARNQENLDKGRCNPACAEVNVLNAITASIPNLKLWNMVPGLFGHSIVEYNGGENAAMHNHHFHHHLDEQCELFKFELHQLHAQMEKKEKSGTIMDSKDYDFVKDKYESLCTSTMLMDDQQHHHGGQHEHGGHHDFSTMTEKDQQDLYGAGSFDTKEMRSEKNVHLKGKRAAGKVGEVGEEEEEEVGGTGISRHFLNRRDSEARNNGEVLLQTNQRRLHLQAAKQTTQDGTKGSGGGARHARMEQYHTVMQLETVVSCGPVWQAGACFVISVKNAFMSIAAKFHDGSRRDLSVCKHKCSMTNKVDESGTPLTLKMQVVSGLRGEKLEEIEVANDACPMTKVRKYGESRTTEATLDQKSRCVANVMGEVDGTCLYCAGPGSLCRFNSDCVSESCRHASKFDRVSGLHDGKCSDMNRLAGASCHNDNECAGHMVCRGALIYGKGTCMISAVEQLSGSGSGGSEGSGAMNPCAANDKGEVPAGCSCSLHKHCQSKACQGTPALKRLGYGVCQYSEKPVLSSCKEIQDCAECGTRRSRGALGLYQCVWSPGKAENVVEEWQEWEDTETVEEQEVKIPSPPIIVTRDVAGCHAKKDGRDWSSNRWIDYQHSSMCEKKPIQTKAVDNCKTIESCGACVVAHKRNTKSRLVMGSSAGECVWSVGVSEGGPTYELWEGSGSVQVHRKKGGCQRSSTEALTWEVGRYVDRKHASMCTTSTMESVNDRERNEKEKCEELDMIEKNCKKCDDVGFCQSEMQLIKCSKWHSTKLLGHCNKCQCKHKTD